MKSPFLAPAAWLPTSWLGQTLISRPELSCIQDNLSQLWLLITQLIHHHNQYFLNNFESRTMKLLHIDSSILGTNSVSRALTHQVVEQWRAAHPGTVVDYLDLAQDAPSHLDAHSIGFRAPPQSTPLTQRQIAENAISEALVTQFLEIGRAHV